MAVKSGPGEASARRGRGEYDEETDRIVAALSDPAEPIPAAEVLSASPVPSAPTTPATPVAAPAPLPPPRSAAVSSLQRRSRAAWGERIVRLVMALIMASLLWIYVLDLDNPAGKWTADQITVEAVGTADNLSPRTPVGSVNITVQAPQDVTARLRGDSFSPHVNLAGLGPGVHTVDVEYTTPPGVLSVTLEPAQLTVQLIQQGRITLPAQLRLQGEPSLSYKVVEGSQQVTPSEVTVVGPLDAIQRVNAVVAEINIDNRQGTVQGEVQPRALDFSGQEVLGVKYNPTTVGVKVEIEQLLGYKSLPVNVPITGQPAPGYLVTSIDVQPTTFNFYGLPSVLEPLNSLETNPVDISGLTQTLRVDVTVPLTDGMALYPPGTSSRVQVRVEIEELTASTKLTVPVQIAGLSPGLQAKSSPDHIDVTIGGAVNLLQGVKLDDVIVSANVTNYSTGNYTVQIDIALPTGTTLISVNPDKVRVDISPLPTPTPTVTATPLPTQTPTLTATPTMTPESTTTPTPEVTQEATTPEPTIATPPQPTP